MLFSRLLNKKKHYFLKLATRKTYKIPLLKIRRFVATAAAAAAAAVAAAVAAALGVLLAVRLDFLRFLVRHRPLLLQLDLGLPTL